MDFRGRRAIFFITILCAVMNSEPTPPNLTRYPVNYFILALQWPGAYRYPYRCPCKVIADFLIHGLWEEPSASAPCRDQVNFPQGRLLRDMKKWWPSIIECNDTRLWTHEWQNHGYFSNLGPKDYFKKTINLRGKVDPLGVLLQNKIYPSSCSYSTDRIRTALEKIGGFAGIACYESDVLLEIRFCVDSTASAFEGCRGEMEESRRCGSQIYFLPCDDSWYSPYNSGTTPCTPRTTPGTPRTTPGTTPGTPCTTPGTTSRTTPGICRQPSLKSLFQI